MEEREVAGEGGGSGFDLLAGFYLLSFWGIYIEEDFVGFFPFRVFPGQIFVFLLYGCSCLSFSDPVYMLLS